MISKVLFTLIWPGEIVKKRKKDNGNLDIFDWQMIQYSKSTLELSDSCFDIQKGTLKESFQAWGDIYSIQFDIVVNKLPGEVITNVFRFTSTNEDNDGHGARIPAFFVKNTKQFLVRTSLGNDKNFGHNIDFVMGETYHVVIKQSKIDTKYWYKIIINGEEKENIENKNAQSFSNVRFYTSDSFWSSFTNQFGSVCKFKILQDGGEVLKRVQLFRNKDLDSCPRNTVGFLIIVNEYKDYSLMKSRNKAT